MSRTTITAHGHRVNEYRPIELLVYIDKAISKPRNPRSATSAKPETQLEIHA
jgi:hypothetical protein